MHGSVGTNFEYERARDENERDGSRVLHPEAALPRANDDSRPRAYKLDRFGNCR